MSNTVRHAHASRIVIELRGTADGVLLQVEDDGTGLPAKLPEAGMGLRTMAYRARAIQGELKVSPTPAGGVRISCRVPNPACGPVPRYHPVDSPWTPAT